MRPNTSAVAVYVVVPTADDPTCTEASSWISNEHFPDKECSSVIATTLPADLPQDLIEHLRVGLSKTPNATLLVVRPLEI